MVCSIRQSEARLKSPNAAIVVPVTGCQSGATEKKCRLETTVSINTVHHVRVLDSLIVGSVAIIIFLLTYKPDLRQRPVFRQVALLILLTPLLIPVVNLVSGLGVPKLHDIGTTTADPGRAIWAGLNPYDLYIDDLGANLVHDTSFGGYKYLPTMALVYSPFVLLAGNKGILFANLAFYTATAVAVFVLFRELTGKISYLAVLLVLATPVVSAEALAMGRPTSRRFCLFS